MRDLNNYLTTAHAARGGTMLLSVATGAATGMVAQSWGVPLYLSFLMCILATGAVEVLRAKFYVPSGVNEADTDLNRRVTLLTAAFSLASIFAALYIRKEPENEAKGKVLLAQKSVLASGKYAAQGKIELAIQAAQQAKNTLSLAAANKLPAPPEYFVDTIEIIANVARVVPSPQLSSKLQDVRLSLADYRSSLVPVQIAYQLKMTVGPDAAWKIPGPGARVMGVYVDVSQVKGDFIQLEFPLKPRPIDNFRIDGSVIAGGSQTLDDIHWANIAFIGTRIKYKGGKLDLQNVTFFGCTFNAPDNSAGIEFANSVALLRSTLTIG
jgi:hypothetical protein